ncbi:MAG: sigma-70 family RNA polymerase sigma factor [Oscillospiraceae bacterium]
MEVATVPDKIREETLCRMMTQYKNDLMRMCAAYLKDSALAEDAVQETFLKAYKALETFRGDSSEKTWLMHIAINTCRSIRRDRWFRYVDRSVTTEALPLKTASDEDQALMEAVMSLPYRLKEVVLLYYYQGMTLKEISEVLGIAASSISARLQKAREKLRCDLEGGREHV